MSGEDSDQSDREYLCDMLQMTAAYHNHKEQMAYTILGVEGAFFLGLFLLGNWPPGVEAIPKWLLLIAFVITWVLFHIALRFQLRNRRLAALRVAALVDALEDRGGLTVNLADIAFERAGAFKQSVDAMLLPVRSATIDGDLGRKDFTDGRALPRHSATAFHYREAFRKAEFCRGGGGYAWSMEWITTLGSAFLLIVAVARLAIDPIAPPGGEMPSQMPPNLPATTISGE